MARAFRAEGTWWGGGAKAGWLNWGSGGTAEWKMGGGGGRSRVGGTAASGVRLTSFTAETGQQREMIYRTFGKFTWL